MEIAILYKYMQPRLRFSTILYKVLSYTESLNLYAESVCTGSSTVEVIAAGVLWSKAVVIVESVVVESVIMESIVVELSKSQPKVYILSNAIESKNIGNRMLYLLYLPLLFLPSVANTYLPILYKGSPQWYNRPPKCTILFAHTILFNILSLSAVSTVSFDLSFRFWLILLWLSTVDDLGFTRPTVITSWTELDCELWLSGGYGCPMARL